MADAFNVNIQYVGTVFWKSLKKQDCLVCPTPMLLHFSWG